MDKILVGDVGGTNIRLGLGHRNHTGKIVVENIWISPNDRFNNIDEAISEYVGNLSFQPKKAALALAGPLTNGCITLTNRGWTICANTLKQKFKFDCAQIYNDFAAMARSVPECEDKDFKVLHSANAMPKKPILVAGPGTGFGMAILTINDGRWTVMSSEGGHIAYAPQSKKETEILHILQTRHDFVSLEIISSGSGMDHVHKAVCTRLGKTYTQLSPADIRTLALSGDQACLDVCEIQANAIMGAVGDIALATGARGGVILAGGVSKKLIDFIDTPTALERYFNRGPRREYISNIPVRLLEKQTAALYGVTALYLDNNDR